VLETAFGQPGLPERKALTFFADPIRKRNVHVLKRDFEWPVAHHRFDLPHDADARRIDRHDECEIPPRAPFF